jgi:hypothetical protein
MTANLDTDKTSLECYLDGKQTTEQKRFFRVFLVGIEKGELLYRVSSGEAQNAPLKMSVRSIFVKYRTSVQISETGGETNYPKIRCEGRCSSSQSTLENCQNIRKGFLDLESSGGLSSGQFVRLEL